MVGMGEQHPQVNISQNIVLGLEIFFWYFTEAPKSRSLPSEFNQSVKVGLIIYVSFSLLTAF